MEKHDGPEWAVVFGSQDDEMIVKDVLKLGDGLLLDEETAQFGIGIGIGAGPAAKMAINADRLRKIRFITAPPLCC